MATEQEDRRQLERQAADQGSASLFPYVLGVGAAGYFGYKKLGSMKSFTQGLEDVSNTKAIQDRMSPSRPPLGRYEYTAAGGVSRGINPKSSISPQPIENLGEEMRTRVFSAQSDFDYFQRQKGVLQAMLPKKAKFGDPITEMSGIITGIRASHNEYFKGMKTALGTDPAAEAIGRVLLPGFGEQPIQQFVKREVAAARQFQSVAEKLRTFAPEVGVQFRARGIKGGAPELGFQVGRQFVSLGASLGTEITFGKTSYRSPQLIMHKGLRQPGIVGAGTMHEVMANVLSNVNLSGTRRSEREIVELIKKSVEPVRQTAIYAHGLSTPGMESEFTAIKRRTGSAMSQTEIFRGTSIAAMPDVQKMAGIMPYDDPKDVVNKLYGFFGSENFDPEVRKLIFGPKANQLQRGHMMGLLAAGTKGKAITKLLINPFYGRQAIAFAGAGGLSKADAIARELHEPFRTALLTMPGRKAAKDLKGNYILNRMMGYGELMEHGARIGLATAPESAISSITGQVLLATKVEQIGKGGKPIKIHEGLGLAGDSAFGSGPITLNKIVGRVQTASDKEFIIQSRSGGNPEEVLRKLGKRGRKGELSLITSRDLDKAGLSVWINGKEGLMPKHKGNIWIDPNSMNRTAIPGAPVTVSGEVRSSIVDANRALRINNIHAESMEFARFKDAKKAGEGILGVMWASNIKKHDIIRGIQGTVQRAAEEADIALQPGMRDYIAGLSGEVFDKNVNIYGKEVDAAKRWNKAVENMVNEFQGDKYSIDSNKTQRFKTLLTDALKETTEEYTVNTPEGPVTRRATGYKLTMQAYGRPSSVEEMAKATGDAFLAKRTYETHHQKFLSSMEKIAGEHKDPRARQLASQWLDINYKRIYEDQQAKAAGTELEGLHSSMMEYQSRLTKTLEEMGETGARVGGMAPISAWGNVEHLREAYETQRINNLAARPTRFGAIDFKMLAAKAHGPQDEMWYQYLMEMQRNSSNRRLFQQTTQTMAPFWGLDPEAIAQGRTRDLLFSTTDMSQSMFDLRNADDAKRLGLISSAMQDIKLEILKAGEEQPSKMRIDDILGKYREDFLRSGLEDPASLLNKNLAVKGLPDSTLIDIAAKNITKMGDMPVRVNAAGQAVILPALELAGRMYTKGPAPEMMDMNRMRSTILDMYEGLGMVVDDASDTERLRQSFGNYMEEVAAQLHSGRTGVSGGAMGLNWNKAGYLNIMTPTQASMEKIRAGFGAPRNTQKWVDAMDEAATVHISRDVAKKWDATQRLKKGEDLYAITRADPTLSPSEMRWVKVKLDKNLTGDRMRVSYGLSVASARDFDADMMSIFFMGGEPDVARNLVKAGWDPTEARKFSQNAMSGIRNAFRRDSIVLAYQAERERELSERVVREVKGQELFHKLSDENAKNLAMDAVNELDRKGTLDSVEFKAKMRKYGQTVSDAEMLNLSNKLLPHTRLGTMTNKMHPIQDYLVGMMVEAGPRGSRRELLDIIMQSTHQAPQAALKARTKGGLGSGMEELVSLVWGTGDYKSARVLPQARDREQIKEILRQGFRIKPEDIYEPTDVLSGDMRARVVQDLVDKTAYSEQALKRIYGTIGVGEAREEFLNEATDIIMDVTTHIRDRKTSDIGQIEEIFNEIFTIKKSGFTSGDDGARLGRYTVQQMVEKVPEIFARLHKLNLNDAIAANDYIQRTLQLSGLIDFSDAFKEAYVPAARAFAEHTDKLASDELGRTVQEMMDLGGEKSAPGLLDRVLNRADDFLTKSPKAKWLAGGAAAIGTLVMTSRMFGGAPVLDAPGGGPAAPPASPMGRPQHAVRPVDTGDTTYVEPSYGMSDRFMASGLFADPAVAIMDLKNSMLSEGDFNIDDRSMNDAQFKLQYNAATGGRF